MWSLLEFVDAGHDVNLSQVYLRYSEGNWLEQRVSGFKLPHLPSRLSLSLALLHFKIRKIGTVGSFIQILETAKWMLYIGSGCSNIAQIEIFMSVGGQTTCIQPPYTLVLLESVTGQTEFNPQVQTVLRLITDW